MIRRRPFRHGVRRTGECAGRPEIRRSRQNGQGLLSCQTEEVIFAGADFPPRFASHKKNPREPTDNLNGRVLLPKFKRTAPMVQEAHARLRVVYGARWRSNVRRKAGRRLNGP